MRFILLTITRLQHFRKFKNSCRLVSPDPFPHEQVGSEHDITEIGSSKLSWLTDLFW